MLPLEFYQRPDVVQVARDLLGKELVVAAAGPPLVVRIVETEAYQVATDRACHAYHYRRTRRTETMFRAGGVAYVYHSYGIHWLLNVVTNREGEPDAVLIRGVEPVNGGELMAQRRGLPVGEPRIAAGPGALTQALGVGQQHNGMALQLPEFHLRDAGVRYSEDEIAVGTRVGVAGAGTDALRPWRFSVRGNPWVSRARGVTPTHLERLAQRKQVL